jgi:hypothetical protein
MIGTIKPKSAAADHRVTDGSSYPDLNSLHALSRRGLWGILMFMSLSAIALYFSQSGMVPAEVKEMIGELPPPQALHAVLAVSWLSAFVLILGRRTEEGKPAYHWCNIGLPTAFYPLYIFTDQAGTYFPVVFAAGLLLLVIEHATVMRYAAKAIREETDRLNRIPSAD